MVLFVAAVLLIVTTGVTDPSSITLTIDPPHIVTVLVPDRYHLQLTLPVPISPHAESVRFRPRMGRLKMLCTVISTTEQPEGAPAAAEHEQLQEETTPVTAAAQGHQQLQEDATAAAEVENTQSTAAGSTQKQQCADAAGPGAARLQQQHRADQATAAKPGGRVQAVGQPQKAKAPVPETRCGGQA